MTNPLFSIINTNCLDGFPVRGDLVQTVVTSPPYYGLRNYGVEGQIGAERIPDCGAWAVSRYSEYPDAKVKLCGECYVCHLLAVLREVRRILRPDGTVWLNLGDSYDGSGGAGGDYNPGGLREGQMKYKGRKISGLKAKDMLGIPWTVAMAARADGWFLRSDIIWQKFSAPKGAKDRPMDGHEYLFLLSAGQQYYYDELAVLPEGKKLRTVWNIPTSRTQFQHFATMPSDLAERCLRLTSSERVCGVCRAPYVRVVAKAEMRTIGWRPSCSCVLPEWPYGHRPTWDAVSPSDVPSALEILASIADAPTRRSVVFDPFAGSGTTIEAAEKAGRDAFGLELNLDYIRTSAHMRLCPDWRSSPK